MVAAVLIGSGCGSLVCFVAGVLREGATAGMLFGGLATALMPVAAGLVLLLLSAFVRVYSEQHAGQEQDEPESEHRMSPASPKAAPHAPSRERGSNGGLVYFPVRESAPETQKNEESPEPAAETPCEQQPQTRFFKLD
ncbi:MAG: hypothetical protein ACI4O9_00355 [Akkermansia sp.]